mmetsp:Transcript_21811/g.53723  ORF Transcript_21811/g.53723 Transcript_21811/m.53723 type:complete len:110 (+) Transcript_21811:157-486(+)
MLFTALAFTALSRDPAVPLFGEKPYAYGEGAVERTKYQMTAFGKGGQDKGCPDCYNEPPNTNKNKIGSWYIYNDPTWDFSADEPRKKPECDLGKIFCALPANKRPFLVM